MRAYIVIDLGFGDAGKGLLTDFLVRQTKADLVVRFNGGAQAGHNVVTPEGLQHTFSQFGSGTFVPGVKTYLSRHVIVHPAALLLEGTVLESKGIRDVFSRIRVSNQAKIITPFHQAANHIREMMRGENRHGSCGVGVGETVEDALAHQEDTILAGDLSKPSILRQKLHSIRKRKREQMLELSLGNLSGARFGGEGEIFTSEQVIENWLTNISRIHALGLVVSDDRLEDWLHRSITTIFEGAQGVLLDEDTGFHPYTTWSRCTAENAIELIQELSPDAQIVKMGVMRSYAVRHGPGPLPTETTALKKYITDHNQTNPWQGNVRYGWFDAVLARYALKQTGKLDSLVITHMDILPYLDTWQYCTGYEGLNVTNSIAAPDLSTGVVNNLVLPGKLSISQRMSLTQAILTARPILASCDPKMENVIQLIESQLDQSVDLISSGPSAEKVRVINANILK